MDIGMSTVRRNTYLLLGNCSLAEAGFKLRPSCRAWLDFTDNQRKTAHKGKQFDALEKLLSALHGWQKDMKDHKEEK